MITHVSAHDMHRHKSTRMVTDKMAQQAKPYTFALFFLNIRFVFSVDWLKVSFSSCSIYIFILHFKLHFVLNEKRIIATIPQVLLCKCKKNWITVKKSVWTIQAQTILHCEFNAVAMYLVKLKANSSSDEQSNYDVERIQNISME